MHRTTTRDIASAVALGTVSALFVSSGLIVNSVLSAGNSSWAWTAALRYLLLLPVLVPILLIRKKFLPLIRTITRIPRTFFWWGSIGFGVFYALLVYAGQFIPGWLVGAGFLTTIFLGLLVSRIIYEDNRQHVPPMAYKLAAVLLVGIILMQAEQFSNLQSGWRVLFALGLTLLAAVLWPLAIKVLHIRFETHDVSLTALQRVAGMAIGSLPVLVGLAIYGWYSSGPPPKIQVACSFLTAILAGVAGSVLFFKAMQLVRHDPVAMGLIEAIQVLIVLFTLLGEMVFRGIAWPGIYGTAGFLVVLAGLVLYYRTALRHQR